MLSRHSASESRSEARPEHGDWTCHFSVAPCGGSSNIYKGENLLELNKRGEQRHKDSSQKAKDDLSSQAAEA